MNPNANPVGSGLTAWWGDFSIKEGSSAYWHFGPLETWIRRHPSEWRLAFRRQTEDQSDRRIESRLPDGEPLPEGLELFRYAMQRTSGKIVLGPAVPDRPVVVDPEMSFHVPPGETADLFVELPLWLRISLDRGDILLREQPLRRLSDTWVGPMAGRGEFCYSSRTKGRLVIDKLAASSLFAIASVRLENRSTEHMAFDSVRLPAPNLSLFADGAARLWTEDIEIVKEKQDGATTLKLKQGAPRSAARAKLLREPRKVDKQLFTGTLTSLFRLGGFHGLGKSRAAGVVDD